MGLFTPNSSSPSSTCNFTKIFYHCYIAFPALYGSLENSDHCRPIGEQVDVHVVCVYSIMIHNDALPCG